MTKLGDLVDMTFGKAFKSAEFSTLESDIRLLRGDNVAQGSLRWDGAKRFPAERVAEVERYQLRAGDVVIAMDRPWIPAGLKYSVVRESDLPCLLVQRVARLRAKVGLDQGYLAALIGCKAFTDYVVGVQTGSAVPHISGGQIADFTLPPLPPLKEQRCIAATLGILDDKIESNRRLIGLSLTLVNAEFSNRFGEHALALELGTLADVVDCLHSKKPERAESGPTLIQLNNIRDDGLIDRTDRFLISEPDYAKWAKRFETRAWDCVITNVGRIGAVARIPEGFAAALGRNMTGIRPRSPSTEGAFIAASLLSAPVRREIELKTDAGTIMNALNVRNIPSLRLPDSTARERAEFHDWASPFLRRADKLICELQKLAALRDALLPELLSGRIRVPEAADVVQDVVDESESA